MTKAIYSRARLLSALVATMLLPVLADSDYTFIISGYPAQNKSYSLATAGTALITSTRSSVSPFAALEARYRTKVNTNTCELRTDKMRGTLIMIH